MPSICHLPSSLVRATASERMPRRARSVTFQSTRFCTSSLSTSTSLTMMLGAPLVHLNVLPVCVQRTVPSVRLTVGSNGIKSSCSKWSIDGRSACVRTSVSSASRGGSRHFAASAAMRSTSRWSMPGV